MRKNLHWLLLATVFMLSIAMAGVGTASPESPVIRVEPKDNKAEVGKTFTVNITVTGITEEESLYGWECRITFNPDIINAVNATEGPFLKDTGYDTFWPEPRINNTEGTITFGVMIYEFPFPPTGATGSGTLAIVAFKAVGQGATGLDFKECEREHLNGDTELYTVVSGTTSPMSHTAEGGSFSNAGAPIPLNLIAGVVVVLAVCAVAAFYFMRRRASTGT